MTHETDRRWMSLALSLGARGLGRTWPNPSVGCVLVKGGRVIGRGWTQDGGRPHAEVVALTQAGPNAKGATAYVTLEPCSHTGKTPPCAGALIAAGVSCVVVGEGDPDPRVAGCGIQMLTRAGVTVRMGVLADQAAILHQGFTSRIRYGRPLVTLKLAGSFDGRIATAGGESQWITGPQSRRYVHGLRRSHDAVMIGGGTARADLPSLTVRGMGEGSQPVRVVLSARLDIPKAGPLWDTAWDVPVWLCHGPGCDPAMKAAWTDAGAVLHEAPMAGSGVDAMSVLLALGQAGLTRVLCEGGGQLAASLLRAGLVDRLICFTAGIGLGADGLPSLGALGLDRLEDAPRFDLVRHQVIGRDLMSVWAKPA